MEDEVSWRTSLARGFQAITPAAGGETKHFFFRRKFDIVVVHLTSNTIHHQCVCVSARASLFFGRLHRTGFEICIIIL